MTFHGTVRGVWAAVVCLTAAMGGAQALPPSLDGCREAIDANPKDPAAYYCVYRAVLADGHAGEAAALLERYRRAHPDVPRIVLMLAWVERMRGRPGAEAMVAGAVDAMEAAGDHWGVVYGGLDLADRLGLRGRTAEAAALLDRCEAAAAATGEPVMAARVDVQRGYQAEREGDYSAALVLGRRARRVVFPGGPYDLRCATLNLLGSVYWYLCRYADALEAFEKEAAIRRRAGDRWWGAVASYNIALCAIRMMRDGEMTAGEAYPLIRAAEKAAESGGNRANAAEMAVLLGSETGGERGLRSIRRAERVLARLDMAERLAQAVRAEGVVLVEMGPEHDALAAGRFATARRLAEAAGAGDVALRAMDSEARLAALSGGREAAVAAGLDVLDAVERARAPRVSGGVRAQSFVQWAPSYYRLAGFLLEGAAAGERGDADRSLAFEVMARFRARELLERVAEGGRGRREAPGRDAARHREALGTISAIQRRLSDPALSGAARERTLARLVRAEEEEAALRDALSRAADHDGGNGSPAVPGLEEVRAALAPDEAIFVYQLWDGEPWARRPVPVGLSWLQVVTRDGIRAVPLPSRAVLRARVGILEGALLDRSSGPSALTARALARLYDDLLRRAVDGLPPRVRRLVIVPDDALFRCPFAALRDGPDGAALVRRFAISLVPSAGVWTRIRQRPAPSGEAGAALILAAPAAGAEDLSAAPVRSVSPWREGLRLAPLPGAEREARALRRAAGRRTVLLTGAGASEAALKRLALDRFRVIDLVTHAVVDEALPERSAIVLAAGGPREDGLLQVREIPDLELGGQLVILSSCGSSSGGLLAGEGVRSLARAFLEAGASAVLASLWPLRDAEAATLFTSVADRLGRGWRVGAALRAAQAQAAASGTPEAGWAGVVVLGDGNLRPFPVRTPSTGIGPPLAAGACTLLLLLAVRRRPRRPGANAAGAGVLRR